MKTKAYMLGLPLQKLSDKLPFSAIKNHDLDFRRKNREATGAKTKELPMTNFIPPIASIDQVWPKIKGYFIAHSVGRPRKHHPKQVLEAIFWLAKAGCQWDMLPDVGGHL